MDVSQPIKIVEVGPRDGLQNESVILPTQVKIELIQQLAEAGLKHIETTSFVSPDWVPQMADHTELMQGLKIQADVCYAALVPNETGLEEALHTPINEIGIFTAASETFAKKNINCSISESLKRFAKLIPTAQQAQLRIRGYISCCLGCPYEGKIDINRVTELAQQLLDLGCYEVSLGDTIGIGTPGTVAPLIDAVTKVISPEQLAVHFHDTYGQALANIYVALSQGIRSIDCSVAGLGGCPYAKGASGNVATEDVIYMLKGMNIDTGVNLDKLISTGAYICSYLTHPPRSKVNLARRSHKT